MEKKGLQTKAGGAQKNASRQRRFVCAMTLGGAISKTSYCRFATEFRALAAPAITLRSRLKGEESCSVLAIYLSRLSPHPVSVGKRDVSLPVNNASSI